MKGYTTTRELAAYHRDFVHGQISKTKRQFDMDKLADRHSMLKHLSKLYRRCQGRSRLALKTEGCI